MELYVLDGRGPMGGTGEIRTGWISRGLAGTSRCPWPSLPVWQPAQRWRTSEDADPRRGRLALLLRPQLAAPLLVLGCRPPSCSDAGRSLSPADILSLHPRPFFFAASPGGPLLPSRPRVVPRSDHGCPPSNIGRLPLRHFLPPPLLCPVRPRLQLGLWQRRMFHFFSLRVVQVEPSLP